MRDEIRTPEHAEVCRGSTLGIGGVSLLVCLALALFLGRMLPAPLNWVWMAVYAATFTVAARAWVGAVKAYLETLLAWA